MHARDDNVRIGNPVEGFRIYVQNKVEKLYAS